MSDSPDVASTLAEIERLAASLPGMVVTVRPEPGRRPRSPNGMGSVVRKIDHRGYVTFKPRVVVDGITYWGEGVGVGKDGERAAWLKADQNRKKLLRDVAKNEYQDVEHRRATLSGVIEDWWTEITGSNREPATRRRK